MPLLIKEETVAFPIKEKEDRLKMISIFQHTLIFIFYPLFLEKNLNSKFKALNPCLPTGRRNKFKIQKPNSQSLGFRA